MVIEIVDLPINSMVVFHSFLYVYGYLEDHSNNWFMIHLSSKITHVITNIHQYLEDHPT